MRSEFLESELELYVQRLLVHEYYCTGNQYKMLKISPSEERLKGYDAKITGLTTFYCQFKTSDFIKQGGLYNSRCNFNKSNGWPDQPFYAFSLRVPNNPGDKADPAAWQHNILHSLWNANSTSVTYVAPLFHTRLHLDLHEPFFAGCALHHKCFPQSKIATRDVKVNNVIRCKLPFFDGLVSIPPHIAVNNLKHSYAFTSHQDITFHSDPEQVEGGKPFGNMLADFVRTSIERDTIAGTQKMSVDIIKQMLGDAGTNENFLIPFINYGLSQAGINTSQITRNILESFENIDFIRQHIVLSASLHAYFGITMLGLLRFEEH